MQRPWGWCWLGMIRKLQGSLCGWSRVRKGESAGGLEVGATGSWLLLPRTLGEGSRGCDIERPLKMEQNLPAGEGKEGCVWPRGNTGQSKPTEWMMLRALLWPWPRASPLTPGVIHRRMATAVTQEPAGKAELWAPLQTFWGRMCILIRQVICKHLPVWEALSGVTLWFQTLGFPGGASEAGGRGLSWWGNLSLASASSTAAWFCSHRCQLFFFFLIAGKEYILYRYKAEEALFAREKLNSSDRGHFKIYHKKQVVLNPGTVLFSLRVFSALWIYFLLFHFP